MKKFIEKLHWLPQSDEERYLEWQIAVGMMALAVATAVSAVMAYAATFRGWLP